MQISRIVAIMYVCLSVPAPSCYDAENPKRLVPMRFSRLGFRSHCFSASLIMLLAFCSSSEAQTSFSQFDFGSASIGASVTQSVNVPILYATTLTGISVVTQGAQNLDYTMGSGGTCATTTAYVAGGACTVQVNFSPRFSGRRVGAVVLSDANGVVSTVYLKGTGLGPQLSFSLGSPITIPVTLAGSPEGIAVDASGNLYIGDSGSSSGASGSATGPARVLKETISNGQYTQSVLASGLFKPSSISLDGAGNVYIFDTGNPSTQNPTVYEELPSNGGYTQTALFTQAALGTADWNGTIYDEAYGNTNIYVTPPEQNSGLVNDVIPSLTCCAGTYFNIYATNIGDVAVDDQGDVFISASMFENDIYTGGITVVYPALYEAVLSGGSYTLSGGGNRSSGTKNPSSLTVPTPSLIFDGMGNMYTWYPNASLVYESSPTANGYASDSWFYSPSAIYPDSVAVDGGGNVYLTQDASEAYNGVITGSNSVYEFDVMDAPTQSFAATASGAISQYTDHLAIVNSGSSNLTISAVNYPSDFQSAGGTNSCASGLSLASGSFCYLNIQFVPTAPLNGSTSLVLTESISVTTNANPATQTVTVTGTETAPPVATPTFSVAAGTYTSVQMVSIADTTVGATVYYTTDGTTPTSSSTVYSSPITVSSSETIEALATANGMATSAVASAAYVINLPPGLTVGGTAVTVTPGATTGNTSTISVTPVGGFTGSVVLTATVTSSPSGAQYAPTLTFGTTSPVSITGTAAGSATLTISTTAATSSTLVRPERFGAPWYATGGAALACILFFGIPARRKWRRLFGMLTLLVILGGGISACGGSGSGNGGGGQGIPGTTPGTYTVTITGTSGAISGTGKVTLTVQ
jgi:hypothetical protein